MKKVLTALLFLNINMVYSQEIIPITVQSTGVSASANASLDVKGQEAFISAVICGVRDILNEIYFRHGEGIKISSVTSVEEGKVLSDIVNSSIKGVTGDFYINSQTTVVNFEDLKDIIHCEFNDASILILNYELASPPVDLLKFPKYKPFPAKTSEFSLKYISSRINKENNKLELEIELTYHYDPSKRIVDSATQGFSPIDFSFVKDKSGDYVYEDVTVAGKAFGGEDDTPKSVRDNAYDTACRNAIENVNGVFIQSLTKVENHILTKDEIISKTLGVCKIIDKNYSSNFNSEGNFEVECKILAKVPLIKLKSQ